MRPILMSEPHGARMQGMIRTLIAVLFFSAILPAQTPEVKPLRVNMTQARAIQKAAASSGIPVMVNYETTWYKSHGEIWKLIHEQKAAGEIRKMVVMDGHQGPKEINVQPEFFAWLTDPVKN